MPIWFLLSYSLNKEPWGIWEGGGIKLESLLDIILFIQLILLGLILIWVAPEGGSKCA